MDFFLLNDLSMLASVGFCQRRQLLLCCWCFLALFHQVMVKPSNLDSSRSSLQPSRLTQKAQKR